MELTSIPGGLAGREISVCPSRALDSWKPSSAAVQWAAVSRWEREIRLASHSGREREPRLGETLYCSGYIADPGENSLKNSAP